MKKMLAIISLSAFILSMSPLGPSDIFSQDQDNQPPDVKLSEILKNAKTEEEVKTSLDNAIGQCKEYEDYEKLAAQIKRMTSRAKDFKYPDILYYACAKNRIEELSYLTKKNDIESGRIYMSVNEKYYNSALECLDKAAEVTKSKDLQIELYFLRFIVFKEMFQPQQVDAVFNEMVNRIASYSEDSAKNLAKLNEMSREFSDKAMGDYAMKLKLVYASKVDPKSAQAIAEEIKNSGDKSFESGNTKEAMNTYNTYIEIASQYYEPSAMAAKVMEIAEKYFNKGRYKDAIKYYSLYLFKYGTGQMADYASYKLALSYYNDRDYATAIAKFEEFLKTYPNSVWFEKGFENLSKLYYETSTIEESINNLQKLVDAYPRRDTRDYAYLLIGILYYNKTDYDKALEIFRNIEKEFPNSAYLYAVGTLITDIGDIKKGAAPSYSFGSKDVYKIWEPYMPINADIGVGEGAQVIDNKDAKPGEIYVKVRAGSKVTFTMNGLEDMDRFNSYLQDKEDESRLPRKIKDETEKDLVFFTWSGTEGGKFADDKQSLSKVWQAPKEPGNYVITINIGDLGLIRPPDSGSKKDTAKTLTIYVTVE